MGAEAAAALGALAIEDEFDFNDLEGDPTLPVTWEEFVEASALPALVGLLSDSNPECKKQAVVAVAALAARIGCHHALVASGVLHPLVTILQACGGEAAPQSRAAAAAALRALAASSPDNREAIGAAVPRGQRGREETLRVLSLYCF